MCIYLYVHNLFLLPSSSHIPWSQRGGCYCSAVTSTVDIECILSVVECLTGLECSWSRGTPFPGSKRPPAGLTDCLRWRKCDVFIVLTSSLQDRMAVHKWGRLRTGWIVGLDSPQHSQTCRSPKPVKSGHLDPATVSGLLSSLSWNVHYACPLFPDPLSGLCIGRWAVCVLSLNCTGIMKNTELLLLFLCYFKDT